MSADPFPPGLRVSPHLPRTPSDERLLQDMAAGHQDALLELHARYAPLLQGLGSRMLASPADIAQGVEDAFMTAWHHARHYDPSRASVRAWLVSIAHHRFLQVLQEWPQAGLPLDRWMSHVEAPGDPPLQLLALAYYRGEPQGRLAEISGLSLHDVESALRHAADRLGARAEEQLIQAPADLPLPDGPVTEVRPHTGQPPEPASSGDTAAANATTGVADDRTDAPARPVVTPEERP